MTCLHVNYVSREHIRQAREWGAGVAALLAILVRISLDWVLPVVPIVKPVNTRQHQDRMSVHYVVLECFRLEVVIFPTALFVLQGHFSPLLEFSMRQIVIRVSKASINRDRECRVRIPACCVKLVFFRQEKGW